MALFAFGPHLHGVVARLDVVESHVSTRGINVVHRLRLLEYESSTLVVDMQGDSPHLSAEGIGKLHVHVVFEPDPKFLLTAIKVVVHHGA